MRTSAEAIDDGAESAVRSAPFEKSSINRRDEPGGMNVGPVPGGAYGVNVQSVACPASKVPWGNCAMQASPRASLGQK